MACEYKNKVKEYLEENLPPKDMENMEKHLDNCKECQGKMDILLNNTLDLSVKPVEVEDEILISKIKARIKGIRRITLYGILGFVIGIFSRFYTRDDFLLTKAVMALPYKLAHFALGIFFSGNALTHWEMPYFHYTGAMGFFPYHPILDFLASIVTPAIVASFIAVIIGYLISDKRVFRRKKIINFLLVWLLVFLVWTGVLYGTYSNTLNKIANLEGVKGVTVYKAEKNSTSWLMRIDENALREERYANLVTVLTQASPTGRKIYPQEKEGYELLVDFSGGGKMPVYLNQENGEMILQNGKGYQVAPNKLEFINEVLGGKENG